MSSNIPESMAEVNAGAVGEQRQNTAHGEQSGMQPGWPVERPNRQRDADGNSAGNGRESQPTSPLSVAEGAHSGNPPDEGIVLTEAVIEFILMHSLRCEPVFRAARGVLQPEHFGDVGETHYSVIWQVTLEYFEEYGRLPNYNTLSVLVLSQLQSFTYLGQILIDAYIRSADGILRWIFDPDENPDSVLDPDAALDRLRVILRDRKVSRLLRRSVANAGPGGSVPNL